MSDKGYHVEIRRRGGSLTPPDYHATITRSDGVELIRIRRWRWVLNRDTRRKALDRLFAKYDADVERINDVKRFDR